MILHTFRDFHYTGNSCVYIFIRGAKKGVEKGACPVCNAEGDEIRVFFKCKRTQVMEINFER